MPHLTKRQKQILAFIQEQIRVKGYPPSVREIGAAVGLTSSSTVHGHLQKLEEKGVLRRDATKPRAMELLVETPPPKQYLVPVIGEVTAGQPITAVENIIDYFPIPRDMARYGQDLFILKVRGNSMVEAGILDGDLVIVRQQPTAQNGEIVVALLEDEATVKRFFREDGYVRLQPENPVFAPILTRDVQILGKVVGVFRQIS
ncbi:MAG TPA: transcriptional repressor LexA [Firmicutes bacterium]|jgi:repressor LexA|nr:transcriptional repressor LexA [Bacillota bacterium]